MGSCTGVCQDPVMGSCRIFSGSCQDPSRIFYQGIALCLDTAKLEMFVYLEQAASVSNLNVLELSVPWEKNVIVLVPWKLTFKTIIITKPPESSCTLQEL